MLYKTVVAISYQGERVAKGVEVEMDPKVAENLVDDVVPVEGTVAEAEADETKEEKALGDMSKDELVAKATELDLSASGSKADLIERITLHLEGAGEDEEADETKED